MTSPLDTLTAEERAWILQDEQRWRRAYEIAAKHGVDASGVYHVLRNLEKPPSRRLRDAIRHGNLRGAHAG